MLAATFGLNSSYVESNSPLYAGIHTQTNYATYAQLDFRWEIISITGGVRNEWFIVDKNRYQKTVKRAGINIEITRSTFLRASYGEGYRFPSIAERFITTSVGGLNIFPNATLQPELGTNYEAGIKQGFKISNWSGFVDFALFQTYYDNMVEFNFGQWQSAFTINSFGFKSVNIGNTRISGYEISVGTQGTIGPVGLNIIAGYTSINPKVINADAVFATDSASPANVFTYKKASTDTSNNELKYRFNHMAKADIELTWKRFLLGVSMRYNSYMNNIDKAFVVLPIVPGIQRAREMNKDGDYFWDMRLGVTVNKHVKLFYIVSNLLNHESLTRPADMRPTRLSSVKMTIEF
jgi:iron complex outermembrane receptor protein